MRSRHQKSQRPVRVMLKMYALPDDRYAHDFNYDRNDDEDFEKGCALAALESDLTLYFGRKYGEVIDSVIVGQDAELNSFEDLLDIVDDDDGWEPFQGHLTPANVVGKMFSDECSLRQVTPELRNAILLTLNNRNRSDLPNWDRARRAGSARRRVKKFLDRNMGNYVFMGSVEER